MAIERRAFEIRAAGRRLTGHAAVWNSPTRIGHFEEVVARGAFKASLEANSDILLLADHDVTRVLARTRNGSLQLREDERGLAFSTGELPDTSTAHDVLELVRSGVAGGASFAFTVPEGGERWQGERRTLVAVNLHEVSVVAGHAAYDATSVHVRSCSMPWRLCQARRYLETC